MQIGYKEVCSDCGGENWFTMQNAQVLECWKCGCRWALDESHDIKDKKCEVGRKKPE